MAGYDDAVFIQKCKRRAVGGVITPDAVVDCIQECMQDVFDAITPDRHEEARCHIRDNYLNALTWQLTDAGLTIGA